MSKLMLITAFMFLSANPIWQHNLQDAKAIAKKEHKLILLNFSGSDWCIPCIRMHNEIFNSAAFTQYSSANIVLVNADFPRSKKNKLSKEQQKINDDLAERYNPNGNFPLTLLLDTAGNKIKVWDGFFKNGAEKFVEEVKAASTNN